MKLLFFTIIWLTSCCLQSSSTIASEVKETRQIKRRKRQVDEEDVINRFEMERVSPIYDILRYLPPFEDDWIPNPVIGPSTVPHRAFEWNGSEGHMVPNSLTSPVPPLLTTELPRRENSTFGGLRIEVSKDEEHVVSESGRQFHENSALSWFYSAESYSSVGNFSSSNEEFGEIKQPSPKVPTTRRQDDDHVVSQVPGIRNIRGSLQDIALIESATTPGINVTTAPKPMEEPKPNVTTRYILLQSGRVVAINVTSVSNVKVLNPYSGSSNKNSGQPPYYFGSRIRNKNTTKGINATTEKTEKQNSKIKPTKPSVQSSPKPKPQTEKANSSLVKEKLISTKKLELPTKATTTTTTTTTTTKRLPTTQRTTTTTILPTTITTTERTTLQMPTTKIKPISIPPRDIIETIYDVLQPTTSDEPYLVITFDSMKEKMRQSGIEDSTATATTIQKLDKNRFTTNQIKRTDTLTTQRAQKSKTESPVTDHKRTTQNAFSQITPKATTKLGSTSVTTSEKEVSTVDDVLDLSVPFTKIKYEFMRIATSPPLTTAASVSSTSSSLPKSTRSSSRRPRYRGLSHVNLQAPRRTEKPLTASISSSLPATPQSASPGRRSRQHHGFHFRNSVSFQTMPPGSLTDRRSLSTDFSSTPTSVERSSSESIKVIEEDSLLLRFEPTRRSMRNNNQEISPIQEITPRLTTSRNRVSTNRQSVSPTRSPANVLTTPWYKSFSTYSRAFERSRSTSPSPSTSSTPKPVFNGNGNRVGRNFRSFNRQDRIINTDSSISSSTTTTTKKPFMVYYFEPKRRKSKTEESIPEISTRSRVPPERSSSPQSVSARLDRGNASPIRRQADRRSPRLLPETFSESYKNPEITSEAPKQTTRRYRHSAFIWHQPNVGTLSSVLKTKGTSSTTQSSPLRGPFVRSGTQVFPDFVYRPVKLQRTE